VTRNTFRCPEPDTEWTDSLLDGWTARNPLEAVDDRRYRRFEPPSVTAALHLVAGRYR
jgi:hypothetical protein